MAESVMLRRSDSPLTVLLTGATGFIGRRVVALNDGMRLVAPSRSGLRVDGRVIDESAYDLVDTEKIENLMSEYTPDVLVHLAWQGLPDYSPGNSIFNLNAGLRLIDIAMKLGVSRVVVAGSGWEYGLRSGPLHEDDPPESPSVFAAHKTAQFTAAEALCRESGVELAWARIFFSYGPSQRPQSLIPMVVDAIERGKSPTLRTPGALSDFIYVDDVARALLALMPLTGPTGVINVGTGRPTAAYEVAQIVATTMHSSIYIPDADVVSGQWADVTRLRGELGFVPQTPLKSGIALTVRSILQARNS